MAGPPAVAAKIQIPRWIQLVGLPLVLLFLWVVAGAARHVVFLFLVAALIAFLLNPLVRGLTRVWIPRGFGVAIVYLTFAAIVIGAGAALGTVVVNQTKSSASRVNDYFTVEHGQAHRTHAYRDVDRFQHWLDTHRLGSIKVRKQGHDFVERIRKKDVSKYTGKVINFVEGAAIGTLKPLMGTGTYVNDVVEADTNGAQIYGKAKYERLVGLKRKYDPDNFFRLNQNIKP